MWGTVRGEMVRAKISTLNDFLDNLEGRSTPRGRKAIRREIGLFTIVTKTVLAYMFTDVNTNVITGNLQMYMAGCCKGC